MTTPSALPRIRPGTATSASPRNTTPPSTSSTPTMLLPARVNLTSREWIIPPRAKPGRKPATDTPPSKRKAQNRQAQRAFRERRANKVNELEDQMDDLDRGHRDEMEEMAGRVRMMEAQMQQVMAVVDVFKGRCEGLEREVESEREQRRRAEEVASLVGGLDGEAVPLPRRRKPAAPPDMRKAENAEGTSDGLSESLACGKCTPERCACIESIIEESNVGRVAIADTGDTAKRPHSPAIPNGDVYKRPRTASGPSYEPLEMDFTTRPTLAQLPSDTRSTAGISLPLPTPPVPPLSLTRPVDPCGFCQDNGVCLCAELADQADQNGREDGKDADVQVQAISPSTMSRDPAASPGALHGVSTGYAPRSQPLEMTSGCAREPGSCNQCQSDSRSKEFCLGLASTQPSLSRRPDTSTAATSTTSRSRPGSSGRADRRKVNAITTVAQTGSTRMQTDRTAMRAGPRDVQSVTGPTMSCADAFRSLRSHPNYDVAIQRREEWMPGLHSVPVGDSTTGSNGGQQVMNRNQSGGGGVSQVAGDVSHRQHGQTASLEGRTAFEIEAASVMSVLKFFDTRFGRKA